MNPVPLQLPDGQPAGVFMCSQCQRTDTIEEIVQVCCAPKACTDCGVPMKYPGRCVSCSDAYLLTQAQKLETWDGRVYFDAQERFFENLGEFVAWLDEDGPGVPAVRPEWVSIATDQEFPALDAGDIFQELEEQMFNEAAEDFNGKVEFRAACEAFNEVNRGIDWYQSDHTRVVRVPPAGVPTTADTVAAAASL
jgi:hypothetical protein